jgi:hypothetical protein
MKTYEMIWRNKWLTADAETIDDMINRLQEAANKLKEMKDAGIILNNSGGSCADDYAFFETTDEEVAKRFELQEREDEEEFYEDGVDECIEVKDYSKE